MLKLFRASIITSITFYVIIMFLPFADPYYLTKDEIDLLTWNNYGSTFQVPVWLSWCLFLVNLIVATGLYFFYPIARFAYLWMVIVLFLLNLFLGVQIATGIEALFMQLVNFLDGAILIIVYFTSVSNEFKNA